MKKLPLVFAAIILSHFVLKTVRKLKHPDQISKEEKYRATHDVLEKWLRDQQPNRPVAEVDARPMRNDQRAALSSIAQANLNLMESLAK